MLTSGLVPGGAVRVVQERGEERGAGVVADAARVGVRVHDMDERLPRARRPWRWGQDQGAPCALPEVSNRPTRCYLLVGP